jgi:L,D-transpeptidase ErfK/SrfK
MRKLVLLFMVLFSPAVSYAALIGDDAVEYRVIKGDTLERIGAKLGVTWKKIAEENNLDSRKSLHVGQKLKVNNKKIIPKVADNGIVINIPDRMLYLFKNGSLALAVPVGLGIPPSPDKMQWRTPEGAFTVKNKQKNPTWYIPKSIQKEMEKENEGVPVETVIPPGPDNPLGKHVIRTSITGIEIHETIWPASVYQFQSHGCIRMLPEHMSKLYNEVDSNTPGEIIYMPVKLAVLDTGKIYLEVHRDVYGKLKSLPDETWKIIEKAGVKGKVDWAKVEQVIKERSGIAEDITF